MAINLPAAFAAALAKNAPPKAVANPFTHPELFRKAAAPVPPPPPPPPKAELPPAVSGGQGIRYDPTNPKKLPGLWDAPPNNPDGSPWGMKTIWQDGAQFFVPDVNQAPTPGQTALGNPADTWQMLASDNPILQGLTVRPLGDPGLGVFTDGTYTYQMSGQGGFRKGLLSDVTVKPSGDLDARKGAVTQHIDGRTGAVRETNVSDGPGLSVSKGLKQFGVGMLGALGAGAGLSALAGAGGFGGATAATTAGSTGGSSLFGGFGVAGPVGGGAGMGFASPIVAGEGLGAFGGFGAGASFGGSFAGSMAALEAAGLSGIEGVGNLAGDAMSDTLGMPPEAAALEGVPPPANPFPNTIPGAIQAKLAAMGIDPKLLMTGARVGGAAASFFGGGGSGGGGGGGFGGSMAGTDNQAASAKAFLEAVMPFIRFNSSSPAGSSTWSRNPDGSFSLTQALTPQGQQGFDQATSKLSSFASGLDQNKKAPQLTTAFGSSPTFGSAPGSPQLKTAFSSTLGGLASGPGGLKKDIGSPTLAANLGPLPFLKTDFGTLNQGKVGSQLQSNVGSGPSLKTDFGNLNLGRLQSGPNLQTDLGAAPDYGQVKSADPLIDSVGGAYNKQIADAIYSRTTGMFANDIEKDRRALEARMVEQGFAPQNTGYHNEMNRFEDNIAEMRMKAALDAQIAGARQGLDEASFTNNSRTQTLQNNIASTGFNNSALAQQFKDLLTKAQFGNDAKQQMFDNASTTTNTNNAASMAEFEAAMKSGQAGNTAKQQMFDNTITAADFSNKTKLAGAGFDNDALLREFEARMKSGLAGNDATQQMFENRKANQEFGNQSALQQQEAQIKAAAFNNNATLQAHDAAMRTTGFNNDVFQQQFENQVTGGKASNDALQKMFENTLVGTKFNNENAQQTFENKKEMADFENKAKMTQFAGDLTAQEQIAQLLAGIRGNFLDPLTKLSSQGSAPTGTPLDVTAAQQNQLTADANKNKSRNDLINALLTWGLS